MNNTQNSIGERISEVLSRLKRLKKISGDREIATQLGYKSASSITEVKNNRTEPTKEFIELLRDKYKVSADWLLEGIGEPFEKGLVVEDYERKTIAMIININAKTDVILSALAEILAKQNGQLVTSVSETMIERVNSLVQDMNKE